MELLSSCEGCLHRSFWVHFLKHSGSYYLVTSVHKQGCAHPNYSSYFPSITTTSMLTFVNSVSMALLLILVAFDLRVWFRYLTTSKSHSGITGSSGTCAGVDKMLGLMLPAHFCPIRRWYHAYFGCLFQLVNSNRQPWLYSIPQILSRNVKSTIMPVYSARYESIICPLDDPILVAMT